MTELSLQYNEMNLFENGGSYINCKKIYFAYYKKIPNIKRIKYVDERQFNKWINGVYQENIVMKHSCKRYDNEKKCETDVNVIYFLKHEILLDYEDGDIAIAYHPDQEEKASEIFQQLKKMIIREKTKHEFCLITSSGNGLFPYEINLKKPKLDLQRHYNDDIVTIHNTVLKNLRLKDKSGLILFHGQPGTGKSTYIRYLIHQLKKKVLFMPPKLAANLDTPDFTKLLILFPNSVFIIEDAEDLLVSREQFNNSSISMLLNLTDGLLGESLGIQIIATFNTHLQNIDKALLRKGRLTALYEFKPLAIEKSKKLLQEIGNGTTNVHAPMTLADIYNTEQTEFSDVTKKRNSIGFASGVN